MKKLFFNYQAVKLLKYGKREIVLGYVEVLDLGKTKEYFEGRGFEDFKYWINEKEENEEGKA